MRMRVVVVCGRSQHRRRRVVDFGDCKDTSHEAKLAPPGNHKTKQPVEVVVAWVGALVVVVR